MQQAFRRTHPPNEESPGLSEGLKELAKADLSHQSSFWSEAARELQDQDCWINKIVLQCSDCHYDALARCFDATPTGLAYIYGKEATAENKLDREGFFRCLVDHFGFPSERVNSSTTRWLWEKAAENGYISEISFVELVRKLRIGSLVVAGVFQPDGRTAVFHSQFGDWHWKLKIMEWKDDDGHSSCMRSLARHGFVSLVDRDDHCRPINEFVFHDPHHKTDSVHWLHIHQAHVALILALGQQYHWRLSVMGLLCRINSVPAQIDVPSERLACAGSSSWASLVFPCVFLDRKARASLLRYRAWFRNQEQIARENSKNEVTRTRACRDARRCSKAKIRTKADVEEAPVKEPVIFVGVIQITQVILWADDPGAVESITTSLGMPSYLGYWVAKMAATEDSPYWQRFLPCTRRNTSLDAHAEYQPLSQEDTEDEDVEKATTTCMVEHALRRSYNTGEVEKMMQDSTGPISLLQHQQEAELHTTFEAFYDDILTQLHRPSSILRMGTHLHLMIRIILDGTTEYLDVLDLYKIVISQCEAKLSEPHYRDGPSLMVMISLAKTELNRISKSLKSFHDAVLPKLQEVCAGHKKSNQKKSNLSDRIIHHHMTDIHRNVVQSVREAQSHINICDSLIEDYDRKTADKGNNILYMLAIITFLVFPFQLLTGIYGMNFKSGFPEMKAKEGVLIFWSFGLLSTLAMAVITVVLYRFY